MGPFDQSYIKADSLAAWLYFATDGLCDSAKARIRSEIGAHYAEAVVAHLAEGESEPDAQTAALTDLGDPTEAAKRFRERHLTEWEAKQIQSVENGAAEPLLSFWPLFWNILFYAGITILFWYTDGLGYLWLYTICLALTFAGLKLIPRLLFNRAIPAASRLRGYALSHLLAFICLGIASGQIGYSKHHYISDAISRSCAVAGYWIFRWFLILTKLRNNGEVANETPPKAAASS